MKPTVKKVKDIRGRRIVGYKAHISDISADGSTPQEAAEKCEAATVAALDRLERGTLIGAWRGHVYVVSPTSEGWNYWIDTFNRADGYAVSVSGPTREDAQDAALHHLAQNLWQLDVDDAAFLVGLPSSVAAELARWIRFQRSYAALRAEGKTDVEAHRLACS